MKQNRIVKDRHCFLKIISICMYMCVSVSFSLCVTLFLSVCLSVLMSVYVCLCVCVSLCVSVCIPVSICCVSVYISVVVSLNVKYLSLRLETLRNDAINKAILVWTTVVNVVVLEVLILGDLQNRRKTYSLLFSKYFEGDSAVICCNCAPLKNYTFLFPHSFIMSWILFSSDRFIRSSLSSVSSSGYLRQQLFKCRV